MLWVLIGIVLVAVIWALVAGSGRKSETTTDIYTPPPMAEPEKPMLLHTQHWDDAAKTSVSKNFGKGGDPTGISMDSGGLAVNTADDDISWLKKAQAFEPRATKLDLDVGMDEAKEIS